MGINKLIWGGCFLLLAACSNDFQQLEYNRLSLFDYGQLPSTPDGSEVASFTPLETSSQKAVMGVAKEGATLSTGDQSIELEEGTSLIIVSLVETSRADNYYIAQLVDHSESPLYEGYISTQDVALVDSGEGADRIFPDEPEERRNKEYTPKEPPQNKEVPREFPPEVPEEPPVAETPTPSCPKVTAQKVGKIGKLLASEEYLESFITGGDFRFANKNASITLNTDSGYSYVVLQLVSKYNKMTTMPARLIELDPESTSHKITFDKFVIKNEWKREFKLYSKLYSSLPEGFEEDSAMETDDGAQKCKTKLRLQSPIVFDFSKDQNFKTVSIMASAAQFDLDNDGLTEKTGWIASGTALLVRDINKDGVIDHGGELFGNHTLLKNGKKAAHGYAALESQLDDPFQCRSHLVPEDSLFSELKLWFDNNKDGISTSNEIKTLKAMGITKIEILPKTLPTEGQLFQNQVEYQARYWNQKECLTGCNTYDVFFSTLSTIPVGKKE